jgi:hypothetical protein
MRSAAVALALLVVGCDGFQPIDTPDLADVPPDLAVENDLGAPGDDLQRAADLAPSVDPDFACRVAWTRPDGGTVACAPRRVFTVESGLLDPPALALARSGSGRLAFAYNAPMSADEAELHVSTVEDSMPSVVTTTPLVGSLGDRFGVRVDVAPVAGATSQAFHVVELAVTDLGNEIRYRQLSAMRAFSPVEVVSSGVGSRAELALALSSSKLVVAYLDEAQTRAPDRSRSPSTAPTPSAPGITTRPPSASRSRATPPMARMASGPTPRRSTTPSRMACRGTRSRRRHRRESSARCSSPSTPPRRPRRHRRRCSSSPSARSPTRPPSRS